MDDDYGGRAKALKDEFTTFWEGVGDLVTGTFDFVIDVVKGIVGSFVGLVEGLLTLVDILAIYADPLVTAGYIYKKITGDTPDFLADKIAKRESFEQGLVDIIKDLILIVEGIAQSTSDTYEENGIGYCVGLVAGEVIQTYVGTKFIKGVKVPKKINIGKAIENSKLFNKVKNMKLPVGFKYKEVYGLQYAGVPGSSNGIKAPVGLEFKKVDDIISYIKANKLSDVDKSITNGVVKAEGKIKVPTVKSGEFNDWFNSLSVDELDSMWQNKSTRRAIERQLRAPGGMHEWHLVSRAPQFKNWGVNAEQIRDLRTAISDVEFINPVGKHGQLGSTTAHNELLGIIDSSIDYDMFSRRLNNWANYRLKGGVDALPEGLRLK